MARGGAAGMSIKDAITLWQQKHPEEKIQEAKKVFCLLKVSSMFDSVGFADMPNTFDKENGRQAQRFGCM